MPDFNDCVTTTEATLILSGPTQRGTLSQEHKKTLGPALKYLMGSISRNIRCDLEGLG